MVEAGSVHVTVAYSPGPRDVLEWDLLVPARSSVLQALHASGLASALAPGRWGNASVGVWGRKARLEQELREADRVEVYRPLRADPKVARRKRFQEQGAGAAGLFAARKPASRLR